MSKYQILKNETVMRAFIYLFIHLFCFIKRLFRLLRLYGVE